MLICVNQVLRLRDPHLAGKLEQPPPEGRADLDGNLSDTRILVNTEHLYILTELIIHYTDQAVPKMQRYGFCLTAEHLECLLCISCDPIF